MEGVKGLYGAPSLALGLVLKQEWARSLAAQARVGQHGLVSRQSVGECPVQGGAGIEALREMAEALRAVVGEDAPGGDGESAHSESRAWWVWPRGPLAWVNVCCQR